MINKLSWDINPDATTPKDAENFFDACINDYFESCYSGMEDDGSLDSFIKGAIWSGKKCGINVEANWRIAEWVKDHLL